MFKSQLKICSVRITLSSAVMAGVCWNLFNMITNMIDAYIFEYFVGLLSCFPRKSFLETGFLLFIIAWQLTQLFLYCFVNREQQEIRF